MMLTSTHIHTANSLGEKFANAEIEHALEHGEEPEAREDVWEVRDQNDVLYRITGEKIDIDSYEAYELLDAYENGYYDAWEEYLSDGA